MNLSTVEIPRTGAREAAADYRREARRTEDPARRHELEEIARAYAAAAKDDVALIALTPTITAGGTSMRTLVRGRGDNERRDYYALPNLAVCRWQAAYVHTLGVGRDGGIVFSDSLRRRFDYRSGVIQLATGFELPEGYNAGGRDVATSWGAWQAMVPIVPPKHRPRRGLAADRLVLWEADDWTWATPPAPPGDPALLRPLGGDLYAVEATWHLTELEQLVLFGQAAVTGVHVLEGLLLLLLLGALLFVGLGSGRRR